MTAATALDEATEVAPDIRERILRRTAEVIPPRDPEEAREPASAGRAVLHLLPGPDGLSARDALMSVITATHLEGDGAIPYLARFAEHPSLEVRSQLMWSWSRFDVRAYGTEVVARLSPDGLDFTLREGEQAEELVRLGLRPAALEVREGIAAHRLAALGPALTEVRTLRITHDLPGQVLGPLLGTTGPDEGPGRTSRMPRLTTLELDLYTPSEEEWHALAAVPSLRGLSARGGELASIPASLTLPQLDRLSLSPVLHDPDLKRIARAFPSLSRLRLDGGARGRVHDLSPLGGLEHLTSVEVVGAEVTGTEHLPPTVRIDT